MELGAAARCGGRYRYANYLYDGERVLLTGDVACGDDAFVLAKTGGNGGEGGFVLRGIEKEDLGRVEEIEISPCEPSWAITNNRGELLLLTLRSPPTSKAPAILWRRVDAVDVDGPAFGDMEWSPCGSWLAYVCPKGSGLSVIKLLNVRDGTATEITSALPCSPVA